MITETQPNQTQPQIQTRSCPLCRQTKSRLWQSANESPKHLSTGQIQKRWYGPGNFQTYFDYHQCDGCGLLYNPEQFTPLFLQQLYSSMPDNTFGQSMVGVKRTQSKYAAFIRRHLTSLQSQPSSYLELGPDIGLLAHALKDHFQHFHFIEPNQKSYSHLKQSVFPKTSAIERDLSSLGKLLPESIDVAVGIHALDHLPDPLGTAKAIHLLLKPGGLVFWVTHNTDSLLARLMGSRWPPLCMQHPQLYSPRTQQTLMEKAGFDLIEWKPTINFFELNYVLRNLKNAFFKNQKPRQNDQSIESRQDTSPSEPKFRIPNLELPIRTGNFIAAYKKCL